MKFTRRDWLSAAAMLAAGSFAADLRAHSDQPVYSGWIPDVVNKHAPMMSMFDGQIRGKGRGKVIRLWKCLEQAQAHEFVNYVQTEGTCVGQASSLGATTRDSVQQVIHGKGDWVGHYAAEPIYAGSKVEIGIDMDRIAKQSVWRWKAFQGTRCEYAVEWMLRYGLVPRGTYGKYDLSKTDCDLAVEWSKRKSGVPKFIEEEAKKNPLLIAVKIDGGWPQACDAVSQGYPVLIGSSKGYGNRTNRDGLLDQYGIWMHATLLWGIDTKSRVEAGCIANSWPANWVSGPEYKYGTPSSSFWTYAGNIDAMLKQGNSYALSDLFGYPARIKDYLI